MNVKAMQIKSGVIRSIFIQFQRKKDNARQGERCQLKSQRGTDMISKKLILLGVLILGVVNNRAAHSLPTVPPQYTIKQISTGSFTLTQPQGIAIDKQSNIYVGVNMFDGTSQLLKINRSGDVHAVAEFTSFIGGLAIDRKGDLFGTLFNNTVFKLVNDVTTTFATDLPETPEQLDIDIHGNLFVACFNGHALVKVSRNANVETITSNLQGPLGVTIKLQRLFVGDNQNNGSGPGVIDFVSTRGDVIVRSSPIPGRIIDLETDPLTGKFFVANQDNGTIEVIHGSHNTIVSVFASGFVEFPRDIEFDFWGNMYVVDGANLYKISPSRELVDG